jgi:hypothetical protein
MGVYRVPINLPNSNAKKGTSSTTEYDVVRKTPTDAVCLGYESLIRSNPPDDVSTIQKEFIANNNQNNRAKTTIHLMTKNYAPLLPPPYPQGYTGGVYKCHSKSLEAVENLPENKPKNRRASH